MTLSDALETFTTYQNYKNWYVLEEEFPWDIKELYETVSTYSSVDTSTSVIFCHTNEANRILRWLGEEEEEFLWTPSGILSREANIIFIFRFDEWLPLLETLFHEFRHVWQDRDPEFNAHFQADKKRPYKERVTEKDAFRFATEKLEDYVKNRPKE